MLSELQGKILTVKGPVDQDQLGITLIHEHLLFDLLCYYQPPQDPEGKKLTNEPVQLSNLGWVRQNTMSSLPNLQMKEENVAVFEVENFLKLGGQSIVDQTVNGISRNPKGLATVSRKTGAHIVAGCGYYIHPSHPKDMDKRAVENLIQEMLSDIRSGMNGTEIRAGLIGEIGVSWPLHPNEEKCLRAAAGAHQGTGAPISIHPGHHQESPMEVIGILREEGVEPNRVIMSHIENRYREKLDLYKALADTGCNLGFDCFGRQLYFASLGRQHPSDDLRVELIGELVRSGYGGHIMLAQDCCFRIDLTTWGGHGYGHILENMVPRLKAKGVSEDEVNQMLVENPKRFLVFQ